MDWRNIGRVAGFVFLLVPWEKVVIKDDVRKDLDELQERLRTVPPTRLPSQEPHTASPPQPQRPQRSSQGPTKQVPGHWCISCGTNKHLALSPLLDEAAERWDNHRDIATQKINRIVEHVNTYENDDLAMEPRFEELRPKQEELKSSLADLRHTLLPLQYGEGTKRNIQAAKEKLTEAQRKAAEAGSLERRLERGEAGGQTPEVAGLRRFIEEREGRA